MLHLVVYISGHGYGHAAQTLPVLDSLWERCGPFRVTFRSSLPDAFFAARYTHSYTLSPAEFDFGMVMNSAIDVDPDASARRYAELHRRWDDVVRDEAALLRTLDAKLVLSNVGYLGLAAAHHAGRPAVAMSSLNWYDIFAHYCRTLPDAARVLTHMEHAYRSAQCFIQMTPALPMPWLPQRRLVGPVTRLGRARRDELVSRLNVQAHDRIVLVSLGGIASRVPVEQWPRYADVRWLVPQEWSVVRDDIVAFQTLGMSFNTLLCSADALVTKPGYGSFVEAGCNGTPVIYVPRGDWPEEPYLTAWLHQHTRAVEISRDTLASGELAPALARIAAMPIPPRPDATGGAEAAAIIASLLA